MLTVYLDLVQRLEGLEPFRHAPHTINMPSSLMECLLHVFHVFLSSFSAG